MSVKAKLALAIVDERYHGGLRVVMCLPHWTTADWQELWTLVEVLEAKEKHTCQSV